MYILEQKYIIKIYCDTTDKIGENSLWKHILKSVKEQNLAGATVYKSAAGIGEHKEIHIFELVTLSNTMPIVIEIIDNKAKIENFLQNMTDSLKDVFVTIDTINQVIFKG